MDHLIVDLLRPAGAPLRFFGPSKFDDRKSNPNNWFKKTQEGSKQYDKEVLLIIHCVYSQFFLKLWDRDLQIMIIGQK